MPRTALWCAAAVLVGHADGLAAMNRVGVVFDIDGTLADSFRLGFDATNVVLRRNAFPPISEADYHDNCIYVTPERMARHAVGEHDEDLGRRLGAEFDREYIALVSTETAGFYPGLRPLLERLRDSGAVLGALTNAAVAYAEAVLLVNNARGAFGSVHGADSVARAKPFPDGCLRVASDLGLEPKDCIYVGDAPTDGAAARAAGYGAAIGCSYGSHAASKLEASGHFDAVVPDVAALEKALFPDGFDDDDDEALASVVRGK